MSEKEVVLTPRKIRKVTRKAFGVYKRGSGLGLGPASTADAPGDHQCSTPQDSSSFEMTRETLGMKCSLEGKFPDLVLLDRNNGKMEKGLIMLKRNFCLSPYGPITISAGCQYGFYKFEILWNGETLVTAEGDDRSAAEYNACFTLIKELRKTNYFIEFKKEYWPGYKVWPQFILNPDSSNRQIYRVVCLKNESLARFPFPLSGAIDYVFSENELWQYVEDHGFSKSNADLFILNIEKQKHKIIKQICAKTDMVAKHLLGCSNLGIHTSRKEDPNRLMKELLLSGNENVKYRLIPPGTEVESMAMEDVGSDGEERTEGPPRKQAKLEEIEISQWIVEYLILMDILDDRSYSETAKEIIFCCVRDCPELEEFIIEKKYDKIGLVKGEALIDKKLVGRAQAFKTDDVKKFASEDALENLKKVCKYIEIKQSYSGSATQSSEFLTDKAPGYKDDICWVASRAELSDINYEEELEKLLKRFKNASVEDLFFMIDFEDEERMQVFEQAKNMGLSVRKFSRQNTVCVYKKKRPKEVYKQLMLNEVTENAKYKLILPRPKFTEDTQAEIPVEEPYANLFDNMEVEEEEEKNDDKQWKNQRRNDRNQGRNNNKNQGRNNNRNQDRNQNKGGNKNSRNNRSKNRRDSSRSRDRKSDFPTSRQHQINPWGDSNDQRSSSVASFGSSQGRETSPSRQENSSSRYETGASRYDTGSSRYETGASRYETGSSRYDTGASRYETGRSRHESSTSRYESSAGRYRSGSRYDSASRYDNVSRNASSPKREPDFYASSNVRVFDYQGQSSRSSQRSSDSSLFTRRRD